MEASDIELMGVPGSPYSRKMIAYLRYRRIPYRLHWNWQQQPPPGYPEPKVRLMPTFYFPDGRGGREAMIDSTPIIARLEAEHDGRTTIPDDPVLAFLNALIEDYADEWMTKQMFHYRWAFERDADHAAPLLVYWSMPQAPEDMAEQASAQFARRQIDRLYVVGSNDVTAPTIEASYERLLDILDAAIRDRGFLLGGRPSSADFAAYGQLTQLVTVEPTSAAIAAEKAPRVRAWIDRVEDLSGLDPDPGDWLSRDALTDALGPLFAEIGRTYAPFLVANAAAAEAGDSEVEAEIDGRRWTQPVFPYQAKCAAALRAAHEGLADDDRAVVDTLLAGTGCDGLFA